MSSKYQDGDISQSLRDVLDDSYTKLRKPKKVVFFINGNLSNRCKIINVTPNRYFIFHELLDDLTRYFIRYIPNGVRRLFDKNGVEITDLNQLENNNFYICCSTEPLRVSNYEERYDQFSLTGHHHNHKLQYKLFYSPPHVTSEGFLFPETPIYFRGNKLYNSTKPQGSNLSSKNPSQLSFRAESVEDHLHNPARRNDNSKPKILTIIRAGEKPYSHFKILLNKNNDQNYEDLMSDISEAFGPKWRSNPIKKLIGRDGVSAAKMPDLFKKGDVFIGQGDKDRNLGADDIEKIIADTFPNGVSDDVKKFYDEHEDELSSSLTVVEEEELEENDTESKSNASRPGPEADKRNGFNKDKRGKIPNKKKKRFEPLERIPRKQHTKKDPYFSSDMPQGYPYNDSRKPGPFNMPPEKLTEDIIPPKHRANIFGFERVRASQEERARARDAMAKKMEKQRLELRPYEDPMKDYRMPTKRYQSYPHNDDPNDHKNSPYHEVMNLPQNDRWNDKENSRPFPRSRPIAKNSGDYDGGARYPSDPRGGNKYPHRNPGDGKYPFDQRGGNKYPQKNLGDYNGDGRHPSNQRGGNKYPHRNPGDYDGGGKYPHKKLGDKDYDNSPNSRRYVPADTDNSYDPAEPWDTKKNPRARNYRPYDDNDGSYRLNNARPRRDDNNLDPADRKGDQFEDPDDSGDAGNRRSNPRNRKPMIKGDGSYPYEHKRYPNETPNGSLTSKYPHKRYPQNTKDKDYPKENDGLYKKAQSERLPRQKKVMDRPPLSEREIQKNTKPLNNKDTHPSYGDSPQWERIPWINLSNSPRKEIDADRYRAPSSINIPSLGTVTEEDGDRRRGPVKRTDNQPQNENQRRDTHSMTSLIGPRGDTLRVGDNSKPHNRPTRTHKQSMIVQNPESQRIVPKLASQLPTDNNFYDLFDVGKLIATGNFSEVKEAKKKKDGNPYAVKIIDKPKLKDKEDLIEEEIRILRSCDHPNIMRLKEQYESPQKVFLVSELVKEGDLFDAICEYIKFTESQAAVMMRDLCRALFYLHSREIAHRDIKPENLLVMKTNGVINLKLADFGLAVEVKNPLYVICGTPTYVAPEILTERGYGLKVDIWAAGVVAYILLCGFPPFRSTDRNQTELFEFIKAGEFEYLSPYWDSISAESRDFIDAMIVIDPTKRCEAIDALCHPWILTLGNSIKYNSPIDDIRNQTRVELQIEAALFRSDYEKNKGF